MYSFKSVQGYGNVKRNTQSIVILMECKQKYGFKVNEQKSNTAQSI